MNTFRRYAAIVFAWCCLLNSPFIMAAEPTFRIVTKRATDRIEVDTKGGQTTFSVRSPVGIGQAVFTRLEDSWPEQITLRLYLKGMENLRISNGNTELVVAVSSGDSHQRLRLAKSNDEGKSIDEVSPYWMIIRATGSDGKPTNKIPLAGGHFEIKLPKAFLEGNPKSITVDWIDFYR